MDVETKLDLALRAPTQELVTREDLKILFETNSAPTHYQGFEISGLLHIGTLLVSGSKINDLHQAGVKTQVFLADWHSVINHKLGGDWDAIHSAAKYFAEGFKTFCPGVKTVLGSDLYHGNDAYWKNVVTFASHMTLARTLRTMTILGRSESDKLDLGQFLYAPMQGVDIHEIGADIAHAGMDQRKINMLSREVFPKMGWKPPVALHHELVPGLTEPEPVTAKTDGETMNAKIESVVTAKMSKSKPDSAILIHDSKQEIARKLARAYCPPASADPSTNPVLAFARLLFFRGEEKEFQVERDAKFGGDFVANSYPELENAYTSGRLHAADLKAGVAIAINDLVEPVRSHFEKKPELLAVFKGTQVTR